MNKKVLITLLTIVILSAANNVSFAKSDKLSVIQDKQECKIVQSVVPESDDTKQIIDALVKYEQYTNNKNIEGMKQLYLNEYVNADGLDKEQMLALIQKTWKGFPDLKLSSKVKSIRVNGDYAAVETEDLSTATTAEKSELTGDTGILCSKAESIIYLRRYGKNWKISSDKVIHERTSLYYGKAKNLNVDLYAPEQVFAGNDYTVSVVTDVPPETLVLGTINSEPIVYPEVKSEEVFRQITPDSGILERVIKANKTNNNELAIASIGYTELVKDIYQKPQMKLTGIALIMQRVNVAPKSTFDHSKVQKKDTSLNLE